MTTHVFIVNSTTFRYHLEYLFAGTGAKDHKIDFNNRPRTNFPVKTENLLVAMIADANRIRKGDLVIFYLQQNLKHKIQEGKFYGIFKARDDWSFLDNKGREQYLKCQLKKSLTFRTLIEPYKVYPAGVTEWEALDEIKNIQQPHQMLWSFIYRKLKGNRGNTMITAYESKTLCKLIKKKNRGRSIHFDNRLLSFDLEKQNIICLRKQTRSYKGRRETINILPRLLTKQCKGGTFEPHLQAYIVQNIGKGVNPELDRYIIDNRVIEWIGNEVSCGVGMRRIDILLSVGKRRQIVVPIELKTRSANEHDTTQIQRYIDWIEQYYISNRPSRIQPVLICKKVCKKTKLNDELTSIYKKIVSSLHNFNNINKYRCSKLKYVEFEIKENDIIFEEVAY